MSLVLMFAIAGFLLAEIYMVVTVLGPHLKGEVVPLSAKIKTLLVSAIFFGPFGLAAGTGLGLLARGAVNLWKRRVRED